MNTPFDNQQQSQLQLQQQMISLSMSPIDSARRIRDHTNKRAKQPKLKTGLYPRLAQAQMTINESTARPLLVPKMHFRSELHDSQREPLVPRLRCRQLPT